MLRASIVEYPVGAITQEIVTKPPPPPPPPSAPRLEPGMRVHTTLGPRGRGLHDFFGDTTGALDKEVDAFLMRMPHPTSSEIATFLQSYSTADRDSAAQQLIARGVSATAVSGALQWLETSKKISTSTITGVLTVTAAAASAYHGYRRNNSIFWGGVWFACGMLFPVFSTVIAVAQGYGKEKK